MSLVKLQKTTTIYTEHTSLSRHSARHPTRAARRSCTGRCPRSSPTGSAPFDVYTCATHLDAVCPCLCRSLCVFAFFEIDKCASALFNMYDRLDSSWWDEGDCAQEICPYRRLSSSGWKGGDKKRGLRTSQNKWKYEKGSGWALTTAWSSGGSRPCVVALAESIFFATGSLRP